MSEYKEMNPFTGKEIDEDAPANASGPSVAGTGDDNTVHTMRKKKKKTLYDGRTRIAKKFIERIIKQREARLKALTKEEVKLDEGDIKKTQVKRTGNDFNIFYKGNTKYGRNKMIGYFVFDKGNFEVYHDNSDRQDDFQQSDMVKTAKQALDLIFDTANSNGVIKENVELMEKVDKKLALKILSMMKNQKFKKISGDFVPQIYLSGMDKDKLKKEFGRLPRGLPNASNGVPVVDFINYAMGISKTVDGIDTEDGDKPQPKLYDYRTGKVIGKPRTVGDAAKMAGLRLEEVELEEKLGKDADAGDYIDDFKKSDAPQFKGKSDKKKRDMAIAAYLDAKDKKEEVELDELKEPFVVVDTADGNKVVGTASSEKGAKEIITTAQLPPMKIKDKKTLKIVKSKKKQRLGDPIKEGTWHIPDSPKLKSGLKKLMSKPIKLGKDGDDAVNVIGKFIGDDELYDDLYVAGKKNPNGDARDVIKKAMKRLGIKEEVELDEAKEVLSRFKDDKLKKSIMNLATQKGLKVKEMGDKLEVSGNARKVMDLTLAVQKHNVKIEQNIMSAYTAAITKGVK